MSWLIASRAILRGCDMHQRCEQACCLKYDGTSYSPPRCGLLIFNVLRRSGATSVERHLQVYLSSPMYVLYIYIYIHTYIHTYI